VFLHVSPQLINADELLIAAGFRALKLVIRVVNLAVLGQVGRLAELLAAYFALEGLLACVCALVHCCVSN
jgi:hypothetical protein